MTAAVVTTVDAGPRTVSRRVTVNAPRSDLFAMVADPHRHPELDGSGTVRDTPVSGPDTLSQGATSSVDMKLECQAGGSGRTVLVPTNETTERVPVVLGAR